MTTESLTSSFLLLSLLYLSVHQQKVPPDEPDPQGVSIYVEIFPACVGGHVLDLVLDTSGETSWQTLLVYPFITKRSTEKNLKQTHVCHHVCHIKPPPELVVWKVEVSGDGGRNPPPQTSTQAVLDPALLPLLHGVGLVRRPKHRDTAAPERTTPLTSSKVM